jgi:DNA-directed RNA polymerase subunit M/transcription elongation factor TFIIS
MVVIDLEKLKKFNEICHEVTVMWFTKQGRPVEGSDSSGSPTLMAEIVAEIESLRAALEATGKAMDALEIQQKDCEIEGLRKSLSHCQHQSVDYVQTIDSLKNELEKAASDKVEDLATAKSVVLAAHSRLLLPNATLKETRNDPVVYAVNRLVQNAVTHRTEDGIQEEFKCPECGSEDLDFGDLSPVEDGGIEQMITCNPCGRRWMDVFRLMEQQELARRT